MRRSVLARYLPALSIVARDTLGQVPSPQEGRVQVAEQVPAVCDVLDTIERQNWERLRRLLHPEVHWTTAVEEHLLGPTAVIACLSGDPPPAPPAYHELRDGQIIRWIDTPG
jgi:hypothetical protein